MFSLIAYRLLFGAVLDLIRLRVRREPDLSGEFLVNETGVAIQQGQRMPGRVSGRILTGHCAIRSGDPIYVPERSWLSRNTGTVLAGISTVTALLYVFTR